MKCRTSPVWHLGSGSGRFIFLVGHFWSASAVFCGQWILNRYVPSNGYNRYVPIEVCHGFIGLQGLQHCAGVVPRFAQLSWNIPSSQSVTRWTVSDEWPCTTQPVVGIRRLPVEFEF